MIAQSNVYIFFTFLNALDLDNFEIYYFRETEPAVLIYAVWQVEQCTLGH